MKRLFLLICFLLIPAVAGASNFGSSTLGESATFSLQHTSACDSGRVWFGYQDSTNWYASYKLTPAGYDNSVILNSSVDLDSIGTHIVRVSYWETGAGSVSGYVTGTWLSVANLDSLENSIADANKPNFKATGFAVAGDPMTLQSDSLKTLMDDVDSLVAAVADANKGNFKVDVDSINSAIADANKANFKATGFATTTIADSVNNAISDVNKANFKYAGGADSVRAYLARGDSTRLALLADSVLVAITDVNKANFKYSGGADSVRAYLARGDSTRVALLADSVLLAITDVNKANFKYGGGADSIRAYLATHDSTLLEAAVATCAGGSGSDTLDIIVFDGDSTAVEGVDLCIYNPTKTAKAVSNVTTDVNGYCQVNLDPGSYPTWCQRLGVIQTEWDTVTVPSGGGRDTIWVVAYNPGSAPSVNLVRLDCAIRGLDGAQYFKEYAEFSITEKNVWDTSQTPAVLMTGRTITVQIDTGTVIVDLTPSEFIAKVQNNVIVKDSIRWTVHIYHSGRTDLEEHEFYLPYSAGTIHLWDLLKP